MKKQLWIGGQGSATEKYRQLINPYTNQVIAEIPIASAFDAHNAIKAAESAKEAMASMPAWKRAEILEKVAQLFLSKKEEAAEILVMEAAKAITSARGEVDRVIQTYQFAAEEAKRIHGETVSMDAAPGGVGKTAYIKREPLGIIGAISPFNFPLNLVAHKVGPAIASGNTVVLKPASQTPLSAYLTADIFHEAGLPAGALNVITGSGSTIGEQLVKDDRIKMITFTGSPEVGKRIRSLAGLKRVTLELGSNSAVIIDKHVPLDSVVSRCVTAAFSYQGQVCISLQRMFIHQEIMSDFVDRFVRQTERLVGGDPMAEQTDYSALITDEDVSRLLRWIKQAKEAGGEVLTGGTSKDKLVTPTVMTNVPANLPISCREAFGPIVIIYPFSTITDAIEGVNNSVYGLQAGIFTSNLDHAIAATEKIEAGAVLVNEVPTFRVDQMPYGGVKDSGLGREGLKYAIEEMTEMKLVVFQRSIHDDSV